MTLQKRCSPHQVCGEETRTDALYTRSWISVHSPFPDRSCRYSPSEERILNPILLIRSSFVPGTSASKGIALYACPSCRCHSDRYGFGRADNGCTEGRVVD